MDSITNTSSANQHHDPLAILMEEHHHAIKQLLKLEKAVGSMNDSGFNRDAFEVLAETIRFFERDFRKHDQKEEQLLFPMLEKHQPGITIAYRSEHRELWGEFNHLLSCVHDVEDGRLRGSSRVELVESAKRLIDLLRTHIINENTFLFSQTKNLLTPEELHTLGDNMVSRVG